METQLSLIKGVIPPERKGKFIVIEGSDGAGKATQAKLLENYLLHEHFRVKIVDFPRYATSFYGKMLAEYLRGEYGDLSHIPPQLISVIFAMDRATAKKEMDSWLKKGGILLANRYATSNMAHQAARLPSEKQEAFITWLDELEYRLNKIPREDIVIYLHVPYQISQDLILKKDKSQRVYAKGKAKDLVEENLEYLKNSEIAYQGLLRRFAHWVVVECVDGKGNLRSREDIHEEVKQVLREKGILSFSIDNHS